MADTPIILDVQGGEGPELEFVESDDFGFESQPFSKGDKGDKGDTGKGISSISFVSASGDEVTLLVTYDDGTSQNLVVSLDDAIMFIRGTDDNDDPVDGAIRARTYTYDGVEYEPKATGRGAFALSGNSEASGLFSIVNGKGNLASGWSSVALGLSNSVDTGDSLLGYSNGSLDIAIGTENEIHVPNSEAGEGVYNFSAHNLARGVGNKIGNGGGVYSYYNLADGWHNEVYSEYYGRAFGHTNKIYGSQATAFGQGNVVHGANSFVNGNRNRLGRDDAGENNLSYGINAVSGYQNVIKGSVSLVSGVNNISEAEDTATVSLTPRYSLISGNENKAKAWYNSLTGACLVGSAQLNHVFGRGNIPDPTGGAKEDGTYIEIVGNAKLSDISSKSITKDGVALIVVDEANTIRSNARTLDWDGNEWLAGKVSVGTAENPPEISADNELTTKKYVDDSIDALGTVTPEERTAWNASLNAAVNANECLTFWHASDVI